MAEEKGLPAPALPSLSPLADLLGGLLKLPQQLAADAVPGINQQVKELPDVLKINAQHFVTQIREIPDTLSKQSGELMKSGFPVKTTAQAISPIPLLSRDDIEKIQKATEQK